LGGLLTLLVQEPKSLEIQICRIFVIEDHPLLREGLSALIEQEVEYEICGVADNAGSALEQIGATQPDLVVMDWSLPEGGGIQLLMDLKKKFPKVGVLVFSMHEETLYAERAIRAGASGYLMKSHPPDDLLMAIKTIQKGELAVSPIVQARLSENTPRKKFSTSHSTLMDLSNREIQIFEALGRGLGVKEIAMSLGLSVKTIEAHNSNIKRKLKLKDGQQLLQEAARWERNV
jgi:DNA-binding NarL/FixJ family response regulator